MTVITAFVIPDADMRRGSFAKFKDKESAHISPPSLACSTRFAGSSGLLRTRRQFLRTYAPWTLSRIRFRVGAIPLIPAAAYGYPGMAVPSKRIGDMYLLRFETQPQRGARAMRKLLTLAVSPTCTWAIAGPDPFFVTSMRQKPEVGCPAFMSFFLTVPIIPPSLGPASLPAVDGQKAARTSSTVMLCREAIPKGPRFLADGHHFQLRKPFPHVPLRRAAPA